MSYSGWTVLELKEALKARGLKQSGAKPLLIDRLITYEQEQTAKVGDSAQSKRKRPGGVKGTANVAIHRARAQQGLWLSL